MPNAAAAARSACSRWRTAAQHLSTEAPEMGCLHIEAPHGIDAACNAVGIDRASGTTAVVERAHVLAVRS